MLTRIQLEKVNNIALAFFLKSFEQYKNVQKYVYSRISCETAKKFYVGYAPADGLVEWLNVHKIDADCAKAAGLVQFDLENYAYPRFSRRIVIPIIYAGHLVGFGARALGDNQPKYLNSPSSDLYNKSDVLYGLHQNARNICKLGHCFLVEGYFDVMVPYDYSLKNCVATCGTALTPAQAERMRRFTDKVYVMYDGDEAGQAATKRARKLLKKYKLYGGRIALPHGLDPASYVTKYGLKNLRKYLHK